MIKKIGQSFLVFFILLQFSFIFFSFNLYNKKTENDMIHIAIAGDTESKSTNIKFKPQVSIPGQTEFNNKTEITLSPNQNLIGEYIVAIYNYAQAIAGILAAIVIAVGGVIWLTAGGNTNKVETAKSYISGALGGLVLLFTSYLLLQNINPALTSMKLTRIRGIEEKNEDYNNSIINLESTNENEAQTECDKKCGDGKKGIIEINPKWAYETLDDGESEYQCICKGLEGTKCDTANPCTDDLTCYSGICTGEPD